MALTVILVILETIKAPSRFLFYIPTIIILGNEFFDLLNARVMMVEGRAGQAAAREEPVRFRYRGMNPFISALLDL